MRRLLVLLVVFLCILGDARASGVHKRVLMIIAHSNFRDEELFRTKGVLESCGAEVDVVSDETGVARGMLGGVYSVSRTYWQVDWGPYAAVVLVGGSGAVAFWRDTRLQGLLKQAYESGKIVAAICVSPITLAKAGILRGKEATCWPGVSWRLANYGARYTGENVVVSGRVVTAAGPYAAFQFGRAICRLLGYR